MNSQTPHKVIPNANMGQTVRVMKQLANQGKKNLEVRRLVEEICQGIAQGDYTSEVLAIYYWYCQNIRYLRDPDGVEMVKTADQIIKTRAADCDEATVLLAAMCMAAGNPCDLVVVGFRPGSLSHVYCAVRTPYGRMILDPVANRVTDEMLGDIKAAKVEPITQGAGVMDAGIGDLPHVAPMGGNIFSVYDYHRGVYDYYEAPSKPIPATGKYRAPSKKTPLGAAPESFAAALPSGSKKIGSGPNARGMIASTGRKARFPVSRDLVMGLVFGGLLVYGWNRRRK